MMMMMMPRAALLLACASAAAASSKKTTTHAPRIRVFDSDSCDSTVPGTWTGFEGTTALFDSYELTWRGTSAGAFSSIAISGETGWALGLGAFSADNATATISFDTGVVLNGTVSEGCSIITWDNGSSWKKALRKVVHVVAMNHLDVGYNGIPGVGLVNNIMNRYFQLYFPRAVALADAMRALNGTDRFIYTTHPWLLDLYLDCPANFTLSGITLVCPQPADVAAMEAAIRVGDIVFHAAPFNIEYLSLIHI